MNVSEAWEIVLKQLAKARKRCRKGQYLVVSSAWCNEQVRRLVKVY